MGKIKERLSLSEAASFLSVSKETLRNWDQSGKLKSIRNRVNNYRTYDRDAIMQVREELTAIYHVPGKTASPASSSRLISAEEFLSEDQFKRQLARLHKCLRDTDGDSSLISRFDELTKLFFIKVLSEGDPANKNLFCQLLESDEAFEKRIKDYYDAACKKYQHVIPERFRQLRLSKQALVEAGAVVSSLHLSNSIADFKGIAYGEVVRNTFDKGDNQQFFTPREVASFLVSLLKPVIKGVVADPASGTGGFLVEMLRQGIHPKHMVALEIDDRLAWVTGINLFVNGARSFESVCLGNSGSLGHKAQPYFKRFDVIITNPPFGSDFTDGVALQTYELGKGFTSRRRGILFIERCLDLLKDGGYLGIIIDEGVLSLPSSCDVRHFLQRRSELVAVVSLPETAFMPYASVSTSIVILRKTREASQSCATFYARSERIGRKPNGEPDTAYDAHGNPVPNSDLPRILEAWDSFQRTGKVEGNRTTMFLASPFAEADCDKSLRLDFRYHHPARLHSASVLRKCKFRTVMLGEICSERNEIYVPSLDFGDQFILYTGLAQIESLNGIARQVSVPAQSLKSSVKKYYKHDILFARMRPNLRKCHYVEFNQPAYTSAECVVLAVRSDQNGKPLFDPFVLAILLRSDFVYGQIMHHVAGIGRPRLAAINLKQIKIPLPPLGVQATLKKTFLKTQASYTSLRDQATQLQKQATAIEIQAVESIAKGLSGM